MIYTTKDIILNVYGMCDLEFQGQRSDTVLRHICLNSTTSIQYS